MKKPERRVEGRPAARRARVFRATALGCVLLGAGVATAVAKYEPASPAAAPREAQAPQAAAPAPPAGRFVTVEVGGKRLRVNADTMQQGPLSQEQAESIAEALKDNKSTEGLVEVRHEDGSVEVNLGDRFQNVMLAKKNEDGSVSTACVDTAEAARAFLNSRGEQGTAAGGETGGTRKAAAKE